MILVGTSGFSYDDWVGPVYPQGTSSRDFLPHYAARFPFVELNFSYYRQPSAPMLEKMLTTTPQDFRFAIKAHRSLTHAPGEETSGPARIFREGITPLQESGRLAAVLCQFPYSFHYTPEARRHLGRLCKQLHDLPLAVEFRSSEWQRDSVYEGLRRYGAAFVNVDEPRLPRLPEPSAVATAPLGYVRFHGRNAAQWWQGDNTSRYDYLYDKRELSEWVPLIRTLARQVKLLLVAFNNHYQGQAASNAGDMNLLLGL
jgi:uncharacterized protein YecE (DUF72 family)